MTPTRATGAPHNPIRARVELCRRGEDANSIGRVRSGFAVLTDRQPEGIHGCCMLIPDVEDSTLALNVVGAHPADGLLNDLDPGARALFFADLARLGDAVLEATGCEHVNYLVLCNQAPALHAHVVPRYGTEEAGRRLADPFAAYDFPGARPPDATNNERDAELLARLRVALIRASS